MTGAILARCTTAALLGLILAGCQSGSGDTDATATATGGLGSGAGQPFEAIDFKAYDAINAAVWRYQKRCAGQRGFVVTSDPTYDSGSAVIPSLAHMGDVTADAARRNGLHDGPPPNPDVPAGPRYSEAASKALRACLNEAHAKLGKDAPAVREQFVALTNDISSEFYVQFADKLQASFVKVHTCVSQRGWTPKQPERLTDPDISSAELFGVQTAATVETNGRRSYTPLPREIDLAIELAECRVSLDVPRQLMTEAIALEQPIIGKYEQRIVEINKSVQGLARKAPTELA